MHEKIINPIIQEEKTGCGIACCAALAETTYKEAKLAANSMGIFANDESLWSDTQYVRKILQYYKIEAGPTEIPFVSWDELPDLALLSIKWREENNQLFWHWVIFCRNSNGAFVLDSKKSLSFHIRKDFNRMKPKWYITIKQA